MWNFLFGRATDDEDFILIGRLVGAFISILVVISATALLTLAFGGAAHAEDVAPAAKVFDFGPLAYAAIEFIAPIVISIGGPLGVWVLSRFLRLLGLKQDALQRVVIEQGMDRAIGFAMSQLGDHAAGGIPIALKNSAVITAAGYAEKTIPSALKYFRKDGDAVAQMIEARLANVLVDPDIQVKGVNFASILPSRQAPAADSAATRIIG